MKPKRSKPTRQYQLSRIQRETQRMIGERLDRFMMLRTYAKTTIELYPELAEAIAWQWIKQHRLQVISDEGFHEYVDLMRMIRGLGPVPQEDYEVEEAEAA
jgi:hypothetical protein